MVMGWTEDFLLKTLTSTEKTFFRDEGGQKFLLHSHPMTKSIT